MNRLTFLTLLILLITSYSCSRVKIVEQPYKPTTIDENGYEYLVPSSIFSPVEIPEELKDTVVVFLQGGPRNSISKSQLLSVGVEDAFTNYSVVGLKQSQVVNQSVFGATTNLTSQQAKAEIDSTIRIIDEALEALYENQHFVVILGHSYGGLLAQYHLINGQETADKYIMAGVRISFPQKAREAYESGKDFKYVDDELVYVEPEEGFGSIEVYHVAKLLQLSVALDYQEYYTKEMLQRSMFLMGENDEAIGPPSENEINYLLKNEVQYIIVKEGGHRSMMEHQYFKKVRDFIRE
ncbi:hypothetical protein [Gracilimonas sp.]|uniref:hypothetical protein n=1 Tax=Gracilimonas sp. TaxID=1974203 RepID=UPI002871867C|nr:alpha/beta hydrolase [Gracilimonas sp.]